VLREELVIVDAYLIGKPEVGMKGAGWKTAGDGQGFKQAQLDRWPGDVHEWHGNKNHGPRGTFVCRCLVQHIITEVIGAYYLGGGLMLICVFVSTVSPEPSFME
jgi:hypothetical protein